MLPPVISSDTTTSSSWTEAAGYVIEVLDLGLFVVTVVGADVLTSL